MKNTDSKEILEKVKRTVFLAGEEILKIYKTEFQVDIKADKEPVTKADIRSNEVLAGGLAEFGYPILSEEMRDSEARLQESRVWVIDPMDGTRDFIDKTGDFSIMAALVEDGQPILGVVYRPINRTWYWALKGEGAFKQKSHDEPERLEVSSQADIAGAGILLSRFHLSKDIIKFVDNFSIKKKIPCGSLGLKLCYIAEQIGDITINTSDHPREWDICAGDIILREAGGMLTDMKGNNYVYNKKDTRNWGGIIATNKLLHHRVVEYFNK